MTNDLPVIKSFNGCYTKRKLYKLEFKKADWPKHGIASIHYSLEEAKQALEDYKKTLKQEAKEQ